MKLPSEHKLELVEIQEKLSNLFNELGKILVEEDDKYLDDIMQRVEQMKLEMDDLIEDYSIKEN
jgi:ribosome assembly protein YihI (activator of Der GTPase)|tara:strand:+ start:1914 stop:2105 length:192 start_codon:yes stop_codon:yes gene_type:complete